VIPKGDDHRCLMAEHGLVQTGHPVFAHFWVLFLAIVFEVPIQVLALKALFWAC
jgi:hypothetical protein